jgi:hypothetical protein
VQVFVTAHELQPAVNVPTQICLAIRAALHRAGWRTQEQKNIASNKAICDLQHDSSPQEMPSARDAVRTLLNPQGDIVPVGTLRSPT